MPKWRSDLTAARANSHSDSAPAGRPRVTSLSMAMRSPTGQIEHQRRGHLAMRKSRLLKRKGALIPTTRSPRSGTPRGILANPSQRLAAGRTSRTHRRPGIRARAGRKVLDGGRGAAHLCATPQRILALVRQRWHAEPQPIIVVRLQPADDPMLSNGVNLACDPVTAWRSSIRGRHDAQRSPLAVRPLPQS
jgi:hypothetical protein